MKIPLLNFFKKHKRALVDEGAISLEEQKTYTKSKTFDGFLKVTDFPELDHDGVNFKILPQSSSLHYDNSEDTKLRGPLMAKRQKILREAGWTYIKASDYALRAQINVISTDFFKDLINKPSLDMSYSKLFCNEIGIGHIHTHKPVKDIYPPEYGAALPISKMEYTHHFNGKGMEFSLVAHVSQNPQLLHYDVHPKHFRLKFYVTKEEFINNLFLFQEDGLYVWQAYNEIYEVSEK